MEYIAGRLVPHHRAELPVSRHHSDRLLSEAASLTSSSVGELAIAAFFLHGCASLLYLSSLCRGPPEAEAWSLTSTSQSWSCHPLPEHAALCSSLWPAPPRHHGGAARRRRDSSSHHHERADSDGDGLLQLNGDGSKAQGLDLGSVFFIFEN
jgi:hypothetical protein